jgi:hypothetical protein
MPILDSTPQIYLPPKFKNLNYFIEERNWSKELDWYSNFYPAVAVGANTPGEVSTEYTERPNVSAVAEHMTATIPNAKLIYLMRHPVERAWSHFVHMVRRAIEKRGLDRRTKGASLVILNRLCSQNMLVAHLVSHCRVKMVI